MVVIKPASKPLPPSEEPAVHLGIPWDQAMEATTSCCMWPLWSNGEAKGNVCGQKPLILNQGTKRERRSSYCEAHHRRAYHAVNK